MKLDDAAGEVARAIAATDFKHARTGETLSVATIAPLDPARPVDTRPLRDDIAKRKLKVLDDHVQGNGIVIVVEDSTGARARIAVDQGGGSILLTARPANPKLPGKCVPIPVENHPVVVRSIAIDQRGEIGRGETFSSGFRPFVVEAHATRIGKRGIPESTRTTRRFEVKRGKYKRVEIKSSTGVCHHCATWSCTAR